MYILCKKREQNIEMSCLCSSIKRTNMRVSALKFEKKIDYQILYLLLDNTFFILLNTASKQNVCLFFHI